MFGTFDAELFRSLLSAAQSDLSDVRTSLPTALLSQDLTALAKQAHFGMSTAGAIAAGRLFERLQRLKEAAKTGNRRKATVLVTEAVQEFDSVLGLDVELKRPESAEGSDC